MSLDISFAGWLLAVVTFLLGTITPFLYRRFFHEGISIQPAYDVRATTQDDSDKAKSQVVFSTIVKIANAGKNTLLLDGIEVASVTSKGITFEPRGVEIRIYEPKTEIYLPPHTAPDNLLDYLPLLVKSDEERILGIGFRFRYSPQESSGAGFKLSDFVEEQGLNVSFRINGKNRTYVLRVKRAE